MHNEYFLLFVRIILFAYMNNVLLILETQKTTVCIFVFNAILKFLEWLINQKLLISEIVPTALH